MSVVHFSREVLHELDLQEGLLTYLLVGGPPSSKKGGDWDSHCDVALLLPDAPAAKAESFSVGSFEWNFSHSEDRKSLYRILWITHPLWVNLTSRVTPVFASHSFAVLSPLPVSTLELSLLKATELTQILWPVKFLVPLLSPLIVWVSCCQDRSANYNFSEGSCLDSVDH